MDDFFRDIWQGLNATPKNLPSKYFYDAAGDEIFREIMACPEYYLTRCELEIFAVQGEVIAKDIQDRLPSFDVVELGAGDCTKSIYLFDALLKQGADFTFYPIDISAHVISELENKLPAALPQLKLQGLNGDYFDMLKRSKELSPRNKVVLFLGSNIGNIPLAETDDFFRQLRSYLAPGDLLITGFDLKKDPAVILAAYNDKDGITRRFNMNLLQRINNQLGANFLIDQFAHQPEYNEQTGACKSYLISLQDQQVCIKDKGSVNFSKGESIYMEVSQKYSEEQVSAFATKAGFVPALGYHDSKHWFLDALWTVV